MEILKRVVNNKLRVVYYLIVYTVLLVQFPKKQFVGLPYQQNLDPPLVTFGVFLRFQIKFIILAACSN